MISDRAKALLKLAFDGLGCEHGCDIFHAQRDISAWLGLTFGRVVDKAQKHLNQCQADLGKAQAKGVEKTVEEVLQKEVAQATSQHQVATQDLEEYRGALRSVSEIIHPFKMTDNGVQDSAEAQRRLAEQVDNLEALARNSGIADKKGVVTKELEINKSSVFAFTIGAMNSS